MLLFSDKYYDVFYNDNTHVSLSLHGGTSKIVSLKSCSKKTGLTINAIKKEIIASRECDYTL